MGRALQSYAGKDMSNDNGILDSRILIIDDEASNVLLLEKLLEKEGYSNSKSVTDSRNAAAVYQKFQPDLVLLDLNMPHLDGFQVMEQLNKIEKDSYIPVLVLTAQNDQATCLRALRSGAKDFLNKPFDLPEVCSRIKNLLEVRLLHNQIKSQNKYLEEKVEERTEELRLSHEQLRHAEKLSAIGKLAASISHEFNNPLLGIRNILEQIAQTPLDSEMQELVGLAIQESTRVMDLATKLKQFYRPSSGVMVSVDLHSLLDDMMVLKKKNFVEKNINVIKNYQENLPRMNAVDDQIKQVVLNLLQNAEESIQKDSGTITVATRAQGPWIEVEIQDTGCGISPENINNIFEPFFTTKSEVKGTGLGLSVSYGIIQKHGGEIRCCSRLGEGSSFTLVLPVNRNVNQDI